LRLAFGIEGFGGEFAVRFFEQNFYFAFSFFELLLAFAGELNAFFKEFHGVVEGKLGRFEAANDFFEAGERVLEVRLFGGLRFGLFGRRLIYRINVWPQFFEREAFYGTSEK